jgi:hypothetical protein
VSDLLPRRASRFVYLLLSLTFACLPARRAADLELGESSEHRNPSLMLSSTSWTDGSYCYTADESLQLRNFEGIIDYDDATAMPDVADAGSAFDVLRAWDGGFARKTIPGPLVTLSNDNIARYFTQQTHGHSCYAAALATAFRYAGDAAVTEDDFVSALSRECHWRDDRPATAPQVVFAATKVLTGKGEWTPAATWRPNVAVGGIVALSAISSLEGLVEHFSQGAALLVGLTSGARKGHMVIVSSIRYRRSGSLTRTPHSCTFVSNPLLRIVEVTVIDPAGTEGQILGLEGAEFLRSARFVRAVDMVEPSPVARQVDQWTFHDCICSADVGASFGPCERVFR